MSWQKKDNFLQKEFLFSSFQEALAFMNQVGEIAEKLGHHPDILLFNYKYVRISTTTHDIGALSKKDYELAESIDTLKI